MENESSRKATPKKRYYPRRKIKRTPEELRAARIKNLLPGGWNEGLQAWDARRQSLPGILESIQKMTILDFAQAVGFSFEGRPGQELVLRLLHGLPLPEGKVKTYVRRPCDGFVLEPVEVTWIEYYRMLTGNEKVFEKGAEPTEAYLCVGARSGKSTITALEATYQATRNRWLSYLRKGETAYAGIIATNLDQARDIVQQNCHDLLKNSDLQNLIADVGKRQIKLTNGLGIRSFPCNSRAPRGFPYFFTCYDEAAWYFIEGAKADDSIHAAMNPRRLQFPGSKHMSITTPAGKQGRFYKVFSQGSQVHRHLMIHAPTWTFRPELVERDPDFMPTQFLEDPFQANREYGAEFDEVVTPFLPLQETGECLHLPGDVPPDSSIQYFLGIDASGLSGNDRFGAAVAGRDVERNRFVVPWVRSWPDKTPDAILADLEQATKHYRVSYVYTDAYAKGWVHSALRKIGLEPVVCPPAAIVWTNLRGHIMAHKVDLPDTRTLRAGLMSTHGSYTESNRITITRRRDRTGHGDEAEGVARAVYGASQETNYARRRTEETAAAEARLRAEEEAYDPICYGRT